MRKDDIIRVRHMLDSAGEALSFAKGKSRGDLETDRMLALSIVKSIEIVGEAAAGVSAEFRKLYPDIPWQDIVAMRNGSFMCILTLILTGCGTLCSKTFRN